MVNLTHDAADDVEPAPTGEASQPVHAVVDARLHVRRERGARRTRDEPDANTLGKFGLGVPRAEQEEGHGLERSFKEGNEELEEVSQYGYTVSARVGRDLRGRHT